MEDKLTLELLKEVKANAKKWFVIAIIELGVILAIIVSWFLMSYVIPAEDTTTTSTESYDIDSKDNGNAIYNDSGKVNVNGEDKSTKDNN
jgi:hypothetical protein